MMLKLTLLFIGMIAVTLGFVSCSPNEIVYEVDESSLPLDQPVIEDADPVGLPQMNHTNATEPEPAINRTQNNVSEDEENATTEVPIDPIVAPDVIYVKAYGTKASSRYYMNRFEIGLTDLDLDPQQISIRLSNRYFNSTTLYDNNLSCSRVIDLMRSRNEHFGVGKKEHLDIFCVASPQSLQAQAKVNMTIAYDGTVLITKALKMPDVLVGTEYTIFGEVPE